MLFFHKTFLFYFYYKISMKLFNIFKKSNKKVYFLRKQYGTYHLLSVRKLIEGKKLVKYKGKNYQISVKNPLFMRNGNYLFFIDIDNGNQLTFNQIESQANPDDLDIIVGQKVVRELTKGVLDNKKELLMYAIVGLIIGGLAVGMIMSMYYQKQIDNIYQQQINPDEPREIIPTNTNMISTLWRGIKCL